MRRVHRGVAIPVLVSFVISATTVANAQAPAPTAPPAPSAPSSAPSSEDTLPGGLMEGDVLAASHPTGAKLGVGLAVGLLTGFIGTGIGYFFVGPAPLSNEALQRSVGKSSDYQLGLRTGWERKTKSKKRKAFLIGGLVGSAAWVAIYAAAGDGIGGD